MSIIDDKEFLVYYSSVSGYYMYEDDLPSMTDEEYAEWFKTSWVRDNVGVRCGSVFIRFDHITLEKLSKIKYSESVG